MKARLLVLTVLLLLLLTPGVAAARTEINILPGISTYAPPLQSWVDKPYNPAVPTPAGRVDVVLSGCPVNKEAACAVPVGRWNKRFPTIWLPARYLGSDQESLRYARNIFFHELGHVFDYLHLDDLERSQIVQTLGYQAAFPWYGDAKAQPNELFAEAAASCWFGPNTPFNAYGYSFNYQETQPLCRAISGSFTNNNSWFGQRMVRSQRRVVAIKRRGLSRGPAVQWGGREVAIHHRQTVAYRSSCQGTVRFGSVGSVQFNLCGPRLEVRNTMPKPIKVEFWDIPRPGAQISPVGR